MLEEIKEDEEEEEKKNENHDSEEVEHIQQRFVCGPSWLSTSDWRELVAERKLGQ